MPAAPNRARLAERPAGKPDPRPRVLSLLYNDIRRDSRAARISDALGEEYRVEVFSIAPGRRGRPVTGRFELTEAALDHTGRFPRSKYVIFWARALLHALPRRFDAVHCHDIFPLVPAALISRIQGIPLVYDAHELVDHMRERPTLLGRFWDACHRWAVRRADLVITANKSRAEYLMKAGYTPRVPPVSVMNIGSWETAPARDLSGRADLGWEADDCVVIYQGYVAEARHIPTLIEAFTHLPNRFKLLLVGDGPALPKIKERVQAPVFAGRVRTTGYVTKERVLALQSLSDIGVMMYKGNVLNNFYCAPNKLFDYIAAEIPIVTNDLPEIRNLLRDWPVGCIADDVTPEGLARAIQQAEHLTTSSMVYEQIRESYNWPAEAEHLRRAYRGSVFPAASTSSDTSIGNGVG